MLNEAGIDIDIEKLLIVDSDSDSDRHLISWLLSLGVCGGGGRGSVSPFLTPCPALPHAQ